MNSRCLLWTFVGLVTALDVAFAWAHRNTFAEWEMNPFALRFASLVGLQGVLCFRLGSVALAGVVINLTRKAVRYVAQTVVFAVHLGLLCIYVHGYVV